MHSSRTGLITLEINEYAGIQVANLLYGRRDTAMSTNNARGIIQTKGNIIMFDKPSSHSSVVTKAPRC